MFADFISPDDPRWARVLQRASHDVYHLPEYALFAAGHESALPVAFYAECSGREILIPLLIKKLPPELDAPPGWQDAASPYGYPGPLGTHRADDRWVSEWMALFHEVASKHDVISAFVRLHPLRGIPVDILAAYATVVYHGPVVYVDLAKKPDQLRAETRLNHRRNIQKLEQAGFTTSIDDWSAYAAFGSLYRETMRRVAAAEFYFFSDAYFCELRSRLRERLHLVAVRAPNGDVAAAGLFTETDRILEYHLGGTAQSYLSRAPSKLMFDRVRRWGNSSGAELLNLGGGTGGRADSLFEFKAGFSPLRAPFHTFRVVLDPRKYHDLARIWRERCAGSAEPESYFPIYRTHLSSGRFHVHL